LEARARPHRVLAREAKLPSGYCSILADRHDNRVVDEDGKIVSEGKVCQAP